MKTVNFQGVAERGLWVREFNQRKKVHRDMAKRYPDSRALHLGMAKAYGRAAAALRSNNVMRLRTGEER